VPPIRSVLVDFDGTACLHDVAEHLLAEFGDGDWQAWDLAWERGEIGSHDVILAQAAMLVEPVGSLLAFALRHCPIDPTFAPFVRSVQDRGITVTVVSDGFGFYIEPLLSTVGLGDLPVITNTWSDDAGPPVRFENGHPECVGCGTCKMNAVLRARAVGQVAYVGEGGSDRYGALYSDVVFAKDALVPIARADGVPFLEWETFDDVLAQLERIDDLPGPVGAERCPGWRTA
jgi:2-hydroxy-3-keto-5-methylthiopentenyl-1-phosphate phosphatase